METQALEAVLPQPQPAIGKPLRETVRTLTMTEETRELFAMAAPLADFGPQHIPEFASYRRGVLDHFRIPNLKLTKLMDMAGGIVRGVLEHKAADLVGVTQEVAHSSPFEETIKVLEGNLDVVFYVPDPDPKGAVCRISAVESEFLTGKAAAAPLVISEHPMEATVHNLKPGDTLTVPTGAITRWRTGRGLVALLDQNQSKRNLIKSKLFLTFLDDKGAPLGREYPEWVKTMFVKEPVSFVKEPVSFDEELESLKRKRDVARQMMATERGWGNMSQADGYSREVDRLNLLINRKLRGM